MSSKIIVHAALLAGSLVLSGCSGSKAAINAEVTPTPSMTITTPPADGGTYSTVAALRSAYVKAGGACPDFKQTNKITLAAESAECASDTVISTYLSSGDISQLIQNVKKLNVDLKSSGGNSWLVGENWVINSPTTVKIQEKLGGRLVSF